MSEKTKGQLLSEKLSYNKKGAYDKYNAEETAKIYEYSKGYMDFLNKGKTERDVCTNTVKLAKEKGFKEYKFGTRVQAGDKYYFNNRGKSLYLFVIGYEDIENGIAMSASHIDSPRIDIKQNPLYEDGKMTFFKTHYYGGIKKYQWTALPLALHGIIVKENGETVNIEIGEDESDPVFYISDLLPHLSKDQNARHLCDGIEAEELNVLLGSVPYDDEKVSEKFKLNVLNILNEKYGICEEDFQSAELTAVPAMKARDVGFDRSLISSYGHDDKVCAYPSVTAIFEMENPKKTVMTILADKEETGSNGATGMRTSAFSDIISDIAENLGKRERVIRANSKCISADVTAAYDPNFSYAFEAKNQGYVNCGVVISKFTGSRGKYDTNDAPVEFLASIRNIFNQNNVVWQSGELGKVDMGGGGTVAKILSEKNIDTVDIGVAVISMHAPYEVIAKADVYNMHKAVLSFFENI